MLDIQIKDGNNLTVIDSLVSIKAAKKIVLTTGSGSNICITELTEKECFYIKKFYVYSKYNHLQEFVEFLKNEESFKISTMLFIYFHQKYIPIEEYWLNFKDTEALINKYFYLNKDTYYKDILQIVNYLLNGEFSEELIKKVLSLGIKSIDLDFKEFSLQNLMATFRVKYEYLVETVLNLYKNRDISCAKVVNFLRSIPNYMYSKYSIFHIVSNLDFNDRYSILLSLLYCKSRNLKLAVIYSYRKFLFALEEYESLIYKFIGDDLSKNENLNQWILEVLSVETGYDEKNNVYLSIHNNFSYYIKNHYLKVTENIDILNNYIINELLNSNKILSSRSVFVKLTSFCNIFKNPSLLCVYNEKIFQNIKLKKIFIPLKNNLSIYLSEMNSLERYTVIKKYNLYWITNDELTKGILNPCKYIKKYVLLGNNLFRSCYTDTYYHIIKLIVNEYHIDIKKIIEFSMLNNISPEKIAEIAKIQSYEENLEYFNS